MALRHFKARCLISAGIAPMPRALLAQAAPIKKTEESPAARGPGPVWFGIDFIHDTSKDHLLSDAQRKAFENFAALDLGGSHGMQVLDSHFEGLGTGIRFSVDARDATVDVSMKNVKRPIHVTKDATVKDGNVTITAKK